MNIENTIGDSRVNTVLRPIVLESGIESERIESEIVSNNIENFLKPTIIENLLGKQGPPGILADPVLNDDMGFVYNDDLGVTVTEP